MGDCRGEDGEGEEAGVQARSTTAWLSATLPTSCAVELAANAIRRSGSARIRERSIGAVEIDVRSSHFTTTACTCTTPRLKCHDYVTHVCKMNGGRRMLHCT